MEKELEEAKNHFQGMFNMMVDPVVIVDSKGKFLEITDKVEEITGYKKEELLGKNFLRTKIVTAKSKRALLKSLLKRMAGVKLKPYEIEVLTKDGEKLPFEVNAAKIKYKEKPADMVVLRDITVRKKAEMDLKEAHDKLDKLNRKLEEKVKSRTKQVEKLLQQKDEYSPVSDSSQGQESRSLSWKLFSYSRLELPDADRVMHFTPFIYCFKKI